MSSIHPLFLTGFVLFASCAKDAPTPNKPPVDNVAKTPAQAPSKAPTESPTKAPDPTPAATPALAPTAANMDAAVQALMAKPELPDEKIEVQHLLVGFKGTLPMKQLSRTKEEAKVLAEKYWAEVMAGGDFGALVKQYTDDSAPGIYPMTKAGRRGMVQAFGDVGFRLKVGEIGVAPWDAKASPYGWHIIKRLK